MPECARLEMFSKIGYYAQGYCTSFSKRNLASNLPVDFTVLTTKGNNRPDRRYCLLRYGTRISVSGGFFHVVSVC